MNKVIFYQLPSTLEWGILGNCYNLDEYNTDDIDCD